MVLTSPKAAMFQHLRVCVGSKGLKRETILEETIHFFDRSSFPGRSSFFGKTAVESRQVAVLESSKRVIQTACGLDRSSFAADAGGGAVVVVVVAVAVVAVVVVVVAVAAVAVVAVVIASAGGGGVVVVVVITTTVSVKLCI